jgi:hypothetical protein
MNLFSCKSSGVFSWPVGDILSLSLSLPSSIFHILQSSVGKLQVLLAFSAAFTFLQNCKCNLQVLLASSGDFQFLQNCKCKLQVLLGSLRALYSDPFGYIMVHTLLELCVKDLSFFFRRSYLT